MYGLCSRATGEGTFTQYLCVKPGEPIAKKPESLSYRETAAIPLVVLTAFACLNWLPAESRSPNEKRKVVVSGASGGVGIWCVQLAKKLYNCHVIGICSGRNAEFVRELGADEVIDYSKQDVAKTLLDGRKEGKKYDLYIDCVGGTEMFNHWVSLLCWLRCRADFAPDRTPAHIRCIHHHRRRQDESHSNGRSSNVLHLPVSSPTTYTRLHLRPTLRKRYSLPEERTS